MEENSTLANVFGLWYYFQAYWICCWFFPCLHRFIRIIKSTFVSSVTSLLPDEINCVTICYDIWISSGFNVPCVTNDTPKNAISDRIWRFMNIKSSEYLSFSIIFLFKLAFYSLIFCFIDSPHLRNPPHINV